MHSIHRLLTKSLSKSLQKVLLLVLLTFSGCSIFDVVDSVSGRMGLYTINDSTKKFEISDNADLFINVYYKLFYASRGYDYIIYEGYDDNNDLITVQLTEISDTKGGVYTRYKGNVMQEIAGFSWHHTTIVYKHRGKTGSFLIDCVPYELYIGEDGMTLKDTYFYYTSYDKDMALSQFDDDWMEYQGWVGSTRITVALIDITDYGGIYRRYEGTDIVAEIGFIWK